jgi:transposase
MDDPFGFFREERTLARRLKMDTVQAIQALSSHGWSQQRIAAELGIHRTTVAAHLRSKPTQVTLGSAPSAEAENQASRSRCEPYREVILQKLESGLSAQRIYQDLVAEYGFSQGYQSVKRYVRRLCAKRELPFRRMECEAGEEAQVDFGQAAPVVGHDGKRRRPHVLRVVLSHSRKGYSEAVDRQTTENFIRCLENAFLEFGGVPKTLVIDNLRAAVTRADWFEPELNPKVQSFAAHFGTVILPTRPRMPRHKGKVERGVDYVQENALKGRTFSSLIEQNEHLAEWEASVADTRIHGTTREQVRRVFEEREQAALLPLPAERFPCFQEAQRSVHRDGHVSVEKAYYSVPPEYLGRKVWVRWDSRLVRIFNVRMEQIGVHPKQEPGRFSTHHRHLPNEKISGVEKSAAWWLSQVGRTGPETRDWAAAMLKTRGIEGIRVLMGLKQLGDQHPCEQIEAACRIAHASGAYRLRIVRELIQRRAAHHHQQFEFIAEHPVIRPLETYSEFVQAALGKD